MFTYLFTLCPNVEMHAMRHCGVRDSAAPEMRVERVRLHNGHDSEATLGFSLDFVEPNAVVVIVAIGHAEHLDKYTRRQI